MQVLVGHTKAEVFELVRDLDLPLEQGYVPLLKKFEALGLHANRYDGKQSWLAKNSMFLIYWLVYIDK